MFDRAQFVANSFGEVGIQSQYLDGELHLVDNALAGAVPAAEKLQVLDSVVVALPVYVMHRFFGKKLSPKALLDHVAVFKNLVDEGIVLRGDAQNRVFAFDSLGDFGQTVLRAVYLAGPFVLALLTAKFLFSVNSTSAFSASAVELFAAIFTVGFVLFIGILSATDGRTANAAVAGGFAEFLLVSAQVCGFVKERLTAFATSELDRGYVRRGAAMFCFKSYFAVSVAKTLFLVFSRNAKSGVALFTDFIDAHRGNSLVAMSKPVD